MKYLMLLALVFVMADAVAAIPGAPGAWPTWVGDGQGTVGTKDIGLNQDDHSGFDYGTDRWGAWANLELKDGGGNVVATVEMRYIEILTADYGDGLPASGVYTMGAPTNEQGARATEMGQVNVPGTQINGGTAFWISAKECSEELWEQVHLLSGTGGALEKLNNNYATDAERIKVETTAFLSGDKSIRAIESQTLANVKTFCTSLQARTGVVAAVRLPTEKEWEYVCRAGTATAFWSGRLLQGMISSSVNSATVVPSNMMYAYDQADIAAKIDTNPSGDTSDPTRHPPWQVNVASVDFDGRASFNGNNMVITIGGTLTMNGGSLDIDFAHMFDERYQHRYAHDHYGAYTPILMLYEKVPVAGVDYFEPRPYGDASAANMYYRYLDFGAKIDASDFIPTTSLTMATGYHNHRFNGNFAANYSSANPDKTPDRLILGGSLPGVANVPGDWFNNKQLEYREMIQVYRRFDSAGNEVHNGDYCKDFSNNRLYPIRSMYHPAPYWVDPLLATRKYSNFPDSSYDLVELARQVDLSAPADPAMNTNEYVATIKAELVKQFLKTGDYYGSWYTGPAAGVKTFAGFQDSFPTSRVFDTIEVNVGVPPTLNIDRESGRNPWGLLDVHGNLEEWVDTTWDGLSNHANHQTGVFTITKGGSWRNGADACRSAARHARDPNRAYDDVGFRFIIE